MALSQNGVKSTIVERYLGGLAAVPDDYRKVVDYRTTDAAALRIAGLQGLGEIPTWDGSSAFTGGQVKAVDEYNTPGITLNYTQFGAQMTVSRADRFDVPETLGFASQKLGFAVANTYAKQAFTALAGGFTGGTKTGDDVDLFHDNHTTAAGGSNYRVNMITSALDPSGLMAAIKAARAGTSFDGAPFELVSAGFYLVVPVELEEAAHQAVRSVFTLPNATDTAGQGLNNVAGNYITPADIIVSPHFDTTNDWALVSKIESPLVFWERLSPELRVTEDPDTLVTKITCDFAIAVGCHSEPSVAIGSKVS